MRIAQVAPLYESVPPKRYGGTERVVSWLTEELVGQKHDVTVFASADSVTTAKLIPGSPGSLRADPLCCDAVAYHVAMIEEVVKNATEFDIIHFHTEYLHFSPSRHRHLRGITTLHGRLDVPHVLPVYKEFSEMPVVSISRDQRKPVIWMNWAGNVYHGLPENLFSFHPQPGKYLAFIGRFSPEKRPDLAIQIATRAGMPLKIAAKVDGPDQEYFQTKIQPLLDNPLVEYCGEITDGEKDSFLGNALACVFPIDWPEPFGLNMIETMACGTPTIAFGHGSVPEIIADGVTGFVVDDVEQAVKAVEKLPNINRKGCRETFEERFTARRMASDYLEIYEQEICRYDAEPSTDQARTV